MSSTFLDELVNSTRPRWWQWLRCRQLKRYWIERWLSEFGEDWHREAYDHGVLNLNVVLVAMRDLLFANVALAGLLPPTSDWYRLNWSWDMVKEKSAKRIPFSTKERFDKFASAAGCVPYARFELVYLNRVSGDADEVIRLLARADAGPFSFGACFKFK